MMVSILTEKKKAQNDFSLLCKLPGSAIAKEIYLSALGGFNKQRLKTSVLSICCSMRHSEDGVPGSLLLENSNPFYIHIFAALRLAANTLLRPHW